MADDRKERGAPGSIFSRVVGSAGRAAAMAGRAAVTTTGRAVASDLMTHGAGGLVTGVRRIRTAFSRSGVDPSGPVGSMLIAGTIDGGFPGARGDDGSVSVVRAVNAASAHTVVALAQVNQSVIGLSGLVGAGNALLSRQLEFERRQTGYLEDIAIGVRELYEAINKLDGRGDGTSRVSAPPVAAGVAPAATSDVSPGSGVLSSLSAGMVGFGAGAAATAGRALLTGAGRVAGAVASRIPVIGGAIAAAATFLETGSIGQATAAGGGAVLGAVLGGMVAGPIGAVVGALAGQHVLQKVWTAVTSAVSTTTASVQPGGTVVLGSPIPPTTVSSATRVQTTIAGAVDAIVTRPSQTIVAAHAGSSVLGTTGIEVVQTSPMDASTVAVSGIEPVQAVPSGTVLSTTGVEPIAAVPGGTVVATGTVPTVGVGSSGTATVATPSGTTIGTTRVDGPSATPSGTTIGTTRVGGPSATTVPTDAALAAQVEAATDELRSMMLEWQANNPAPAPDAPDEQWFDYDMRVVEAREAAAREILRRYPALGYGIHSSDAAATTSGIRVGVGGSGFFALPGGSRGRGTAVPSTQLELEEKAREVEDQVRRERGGVRLEGREVKLVADDMVFEAGSITFRTPGLGGSGGEVLGGRDAGFRVAAGGVSPRDITPGQRGSVDTAMRILTEGGLTREQAAGVVGNLMQESNLNPNAVGDGGLARGIAQWHPDRWDGLVEYANEKGTSPYDFSTQVEYILREMQGPESRAGEMLRTATTAEEAAYLFSRYYERPHAAYAANATRAGYAAAALEQWNQSSGQTGYGRADRFDASAFVGASTGMVLGGMSFGGAPVVVSSNPTFIGGGAVGGQPVPNNVVPEVAPVDFYDWFSND